MTSWALIRPLQSASPLTGGIVIEGLAVAVEAAPPVDDGVGVDPPGDCAGVFVGAGGGGRIGFGVGVGVAVGVGDEVSVGVGVGANEGVGDPGVGVVGEPVGDDVGVCVGVGDGVGVGVGDGVCVGVGDGVCVGVGDGVCVGVGDGVGVGVEVGVALPGGTALLFTPPKSFVQYQPFWLPAVYAREMPIAVYLAPSMLALCPAEFCQAVKTLWAVLYPYPAAMFSPFHVL